MNANGSTTSSDKPDLRLWQIVNMSVGFFGIQHGFEIQFARMTSIYEKLGAQPAQIPLLWLAAPATGLLLQPIVGYLSDHTWIPSLRARRRPYLLMGAILGSLALFLMPSSSSLWMAAGLLWILDASLNITMEPFRAFVADKQNTKQRPTGFACQSLLIGAGTILGNYIASIDLLERYPAFRSVAKTSTHLAFYVCSTIFLVSVLYSILTTPEDPPAVELQQNRGGTWWDAVTNALAEIRDCYAQMPPVMKRLAVIQFFTWMGLFFMWIYYSVAVFHNVFGAENPQSALYEEGVRFAARTTMVRGIATPLFALCIPFLVRKFGRITTHFMALVVCGIGLAMIPFIHSPSWLYLPMVAAGIGWASIVAMPYVILVEHLPSQRYGTFMGIFNMFIVIPEVLVSVGFGTAVMKILGENRAYGVGFGGLLILVAAALTPSLRRVGVGVPAQGSVAVTG